MVRKNISNAEGTQFIGDGMAQYSATLRKEDAYALADSLTNDSVTGSGFTIFAVGFDMIFTKQSNGGFLVQLKKT